MSIEDTQARSMENLPETTENAGLKEEQSFPQDDQASRSASSGSEGVFTTDYTPTKPIHAMPALPENSPIDTFEQPTIEVTMDESTAHEVMAPGEVQSDQDTAKNPGANLSIEHSNTPRTRRRSSAAGHRRRSSARSMTGLGSPDLRQRSSIVSSASRADSESLQADDNASDFGDFEDFEEGDFVEGETFSDEEGEDQEVDLIADTHSEPVRLPDIDDKAESLTYIQKIVQDLLPDVSLSKEQIRSLNDSEDIVPESDDEDDSPFMLTDRAVSLWKQLTAPPPLQPPDWKRSRIRRLFLVSLGIPVDLDEILPKMTHKKLVLPSTRRHKDRTADDRPSRKKIPPPPEFEVSSARQICATTPEALKSMTRRELEIHISTLKAHTATASGLLTYWLEQREVTQSEKDTFEQVVSNLVQYHKKQKDEQKESASSGAKKSKSRFSMRG